MESLEDLVIPPEVNPMLGIPESGREGFFQKKRCH